MGVDLALLPVETITEEGDFVCQIWFYLDLNEVIAPFRDMPTHPVTGQVFWPIEPLSDEILDASPASEPYMRFATQPVGFARATAPHLKFAYAGDIRRAFESNPVDMAEVNATERAAIAYISNLDDRIEIVLYWC